MHANNREEREGSPRARSRRVGLKDTTTGDTLAARRTDPVESMTFPEPVISVAVEPKSKADQDKLGSGLGALPSRIRPSGHLRRGTGQTLIAGWASSTSRSSSTG